MGEAICNLAMIQAIIRSLDLLYTQSHNFHGDGVCPHLGSASVLQHLRIFLFLSFVEHQHSRGELGTVPADVHVGCSLSRKQLAGQGGVSPKQDRDGLSWSLHKKLRHFWGTDMDCGSELET